MLFLENQHVTSVALSAASDVAKRPVPISVTLDDLERPWRTEPPRESHYIGLAFFPELVTVYS